MYFGVFWGNSCFIYCNTEKPLNVRTRVRKKLCSQFFRGQKTDMTNWLQQLFSFFRKKVPPNFFFGQEFLVQGLVQE
jgi:hypothetical protein